MKRIKQQKSGVTHIRRCHHCHHVNESTDSSNMNCQSCGKHLAPFYFFDESSLDGIDAGGLHLSSLHSATKTLPIWGISLYWAEDEKDEHEGQHSGHKKRT
jgi:hypothetical protein